MKEKSPVIVVEGKTDVVKLQKITNALIVSTNGSCVPRETIEYIKELSKERKIIVLTDPDYPGLRIRNIINKEVPNAYNAYVDRDKASNGKKLGVAETPIEEIKRALENAKVFNIDKEDNIYSLSDLYELGLVGQNNASCLREKVYKKYNLGYGNAKTLIKRLSSIGLTKEELKEYLKEVKENENSK
ncbi:MAG: ribonuclease M5 [Erysipelotrichaceae bacterium]|nr:ribonuclease M5 [Erysipelotrichaceae bacterium]